MPAAQRVTAAAPTRADRTPVIALRGISRSFPGVQALADVDIVLATGTIHAVVGENGAGKSTLLKILNGVQRPSSGTIEVDGRVVELSSPRDADAHGISMVHQELSIIAQLSVAENVVLGREHSTRGVVSRTRANADAERILRDLGWTGDVTAPAGTCSVAAQQLMEIARALHRDQRVIILDEPTASLTPPEVGRLVATLRRLRDQGRCIIYVSHRLAELGQLGVDEITVLRDGRRTRHFAAAQAWTETDIVRAMVGRTVEVRSLRSREPGPVLLQVDDLTPTGGRPVSLAVRAGELVCLAGMVGSGRTELVRAIFGADRGATGSVRVAGRSVRLGHPRSAIGAGIALLTEDRKSQGLAMNMDVASNVTLVGPPARCGVIGRRRQAAEAATAAAEVGLRRPPGVAVRTLSGGNQQKAVLARWRRSGSKVLIFDEPTRGIDVGAKDEIYALLESLLDAGAAVLVVSSDLPEVLALGDRILVMRQGGIVAEHARGTTSEQQIISDATGSHDVHH